MKQLSVVPTAWIADQMEETGHHGNQNDVDPIPTKSLWYVVNRHGDFKPTN